ncbi:hypothetical protein IKG68_02855 [Candidatus Saccharibacteria bacterium]|nr:hypothetical protein [Candidatus Saccharibacteria bacterium]
MNNDEFYDKFPMAKGYNSPSSDNPTITPSQPLDPISPSQPLTPTTSSQPIVSIEPAQPITSIASTSSSSHRPTLTIILALTSILSLIGLVISLANLAALSSKASTLEETLATTTRALSDATSSYLVIPEWGIQFKYPTGVTDIQYTSQNNYDGEIIFTSLTRDGVTYDINLCGGKSAYRQTPFSLGQISRSHPLSDNSPASLDTFQQIARINDYEYFIPTESSACISNASNTDFLIATSVIQQLIDSISSY